MNKTLFLAVNRQGTVFFWPVSLPGPDGKDLNWWRSAREAASRARSTWVRVMPNINLGAPKFLRRMITLGEPVWPDFLIGI